MELQIVETKLNEVMSLADSIKAIATNEEEMVAVEYCKIIKSAQEAISQTFDPIVKKAHEAHKEATTQRAKFLDPLKDAEKRIKTLIGNYRSEIERKRAEEEKRIKAEQERLLEEDRKKMMAKAEELAAQGNEKEAEDLAVKAATLENGGIVVASTATKQAGMTVTTVWKARVIDVSLVPREFLVVNESALNAFAKANGNSKPVPGVEFYEEQNVRVRI